MMKETCPSSRASLCEHAVLAVAVDGNKGKIDFAYCPISDK